MDNWINGTRNYFITPAWFSRMIIRISPLFNDPSLILPYDRGDGQRIQLINPIISPVIGETQRGIKLRLIAAGVIKPDSRGIKRIMLTDKWGNVFAKTSSFRKDITWMNSPIQ